MKLVKISLAALSAMTLIGCGGDSGNHSTGGVYMTHEQIANDFVYRMNIDEGYDLVIVKYHTEQSDYIVVEDQDGRYHAYDLFYYNPGEDVGNYVYNHEGSFFYGIEYVGGNRYFGGYDIFGYPIYFEKNGDETIHDLTKAEAFVEGLEINKTAKYLQTQFSMSEERSTEIATVAMQVAKAPKGSLTTQDIDGMGTTVLGNSVSKFMDAAKKAQDGDKAELQNLIETARTTNGLTAENTDKLLNEYFPALKSL